MVKTRKKLIEVALPLVAINEACNQDKNRKTGHIRNIHKWFAPMPLPSWRAMLLAAILDDPSNSMEGQEADKKRKQIFSLIERAVPLDASHDSELLSQLRELIKESCGSHLPVVVDPFCGGGSTLVEGSRLGLPALGSDLNPIPVVISTAVASIPTLVADKPPIFPGLANQLTAWVGLSGFVADVQAYAQIVKDRAWSKLKCHYPKTPQGATVFAWRWAWAVESPDPAARGRWSPLVTDWRLAGKRGSECRVIEYSLHADGGEPIYKIGSTIAPDPPTTSRRGATCIFSGTPIPHDYIREKGRQGELRLQLLAMASTSGADRAYLAPSDEQYSAATSIPIFDYADISLPKQALGFRVQRYGFESFGELFTSRQRLAVLTFANLVDEVRDEILQNALSLESGDNDRTSLSEGGRGLNAYADAVSTVLGLCVGKLAQSNNILVRWFIDPRSGGGKPTPAFDRHAVPMVWDFAETNPFGGSVGDWMGPVLQTVLGAFSLTATEEPGEVFVCQRDARAAVADLPSDVIVATDPPYYDNIGYADLSDFFYFAERPALRRVFPKQFATLTTPKSDELIATPFRHDGSMDAANAFFRKGFTDVFREVAKNSESKYPILVVYALKQKESGPTSQTGWEVFLEGLLEAGLSIVATWPVRTTTATRMISLDTNALASAIFVVCRPRPANMSTISRREMLSLLKAELPTALTNLQISNIAPVDLAQAAIGPGMAIFSRYTKVLEADDSPMSVRSALQLINQVVDEVFSEEEQDLDADTRFALTWYEDHKFGEGPFGKAETLATARGVAVTGVADSGILRSGAGKVRLLRRSELPIDWDPVADDRLTVWEATQYLIKRLEEQGEAQAAALLARLGSTAEQARSLAYRLYTTCERKGWAEEAQAYNGLVLAWPELEKLAGESRTGAGTETQAGLFG